MKKILIIVSIFGGSIFLPSCQDFLEEELVSDVSSDTYFDDAEGFNAAVNASYSFLRDFYAREQGASFTVFGTDLYTQGNDGDRKGVNSYDARLNATETFLGDIWSDHYRAINQINAVIDLSEEIVDEDLDQETRDQRVAEVHFLRALFYFNLVRLFGDVHLTLEQTEGVETEANRTPASEIYSQAIIPDLEAAIATLPATQSDYGRATKPAAEHLLSLVLLTRGYQDYAAADDFQRAANLADNVINAYNFSLLENFGNVFSQDNQINPEVIWSVQYTEDPLTNGGGNHMHLYFLMEYDKLPGMTRDVENGRPWKRFKPTTFLLDLWDRDIDVRYEQSFKHAFYANNPGNLPEGVELGDTAVYMPGEEVSQEFRDNKPYMIVTPSEYTTRVYLTLSKFLDNKRPDRQAVQGSRDWIMMRLADTYLLAAEAYINLGQPETAAERINAVRVRAARPEQEEAMMITAADATLDFLLDERGRELVGEMHRWFDLTRTNTLIERVNAYNPDASGNAQEFHRLRPIPQNQLDRTAGGYAQNPGY